MNEQNVIVAPSHPAYFKGRFSVSIEDNKGFAEIEKNGYTLNYTAIAELKNFALKNSKKLKKLLKKKKIQKIFMKANWKATDLILQFF